MNRLIPWLLACLLGACGTCGGCDSVAELTQRRGAVGSQHAGGPFAQAEVGERYRLGDAIRTGEDGHASAVLGDDAQLSIAPKSLVRFSPSRPGARHPRLDVAQGSVEVSAVEAIELETVAGALRVERGGAVRVARDEGGLSFSVLVGRAEIEPLEAPARGLVVGTPVVLPLAAPSARSTVDAGSRVAAPAEPIRPEADTARTDASSADTSITAAVQGPVQVRASGAAGFSAVQGEVSLGAGDTVRQGAGSDVRLLGSEAALRVRGDAEYRVDADGRITLLGGRPTVESSGDVTVRVPGGAILLRGTSTARLAAGREGFEVAVERGEVGTPDGRRAGPGESLALGPATSGSLDAPPSRHASSDLSIDAGTSLVVRDSAPPTVIAVDVAASCGGPAVVERLGGSGTRVDEAARGEGTVALGFPSGSHRYQVRCVARGPAASPAQTGRVRVVESRADAPLSRSAPRGQVEADGRRYTVLYSNVLPTVSVRWPHGPTEGVSLVVVGPTGSRTVAVTGSDHRFASGQLGEGTYRMHFEAPGRRSRDTTVDVRMDGSAPIASVVEPAHGSFGAGTVAVSGVALPGSRIVAGGTPIPLAEDNRFAGTAATNARGAVVLRITHPERGTQIVIRRGAGP